MTPENRAQIELQTLIKRLNALYELIYAQEQHAQTGITLQEVITLRNVLAELKHIATKTATRNRPPSETTLHKNPNRA